MYVVPLCIVFLSVLAYFVSKKFSDLAKEREILKSLAHSPQRTRPLASSSLYKVKLGNIVYAVKRLKKLKLFVEEFGQKLRQIRNLKHPNILPQWKHASTRQRCGRQSRSGVKLYGLLSHGFMPGKKQFKDYIEGKRELPWKLRLSIATGIARGLDFIRRNPIEHEIILHNRGIPTNWYSPEKEGRKSKYSIANFTSAHNMLDEAKFFMGKISSEHLPRNIEEAMLDEREYGLSTILDPERFWSFSSTGYTAPEKTLWEQGDVFSFGIIMLELLTGKTVEKSGIQLPKWVRSVVSQNHRKSGHLWEK
ncbi:hypothetical protein DKX38_017486 [Salix brachista]|uniref:Protein kinase domain-containing protein n=1 Tax=Salix brachista TaxID=2182728 RepID=A0A5N5KVC9_9ROSI|nr:hypothetical protein DKX38_017486 [Salix brachista]